MKIISGHFGQATRYPNSHGDVWTTTWVGDGALYSVSDDTYGIDRAANSNLAVHRIVGDMPPNIRAETINPMREYGHLAQFLDDDGMWKANGLTCIDDVLYMSISRHAHPLKQRYFIQETWDSSIIKSEDYGKTWSAKPQLGRAMFPGPTFSTPFFVAYGQNGSATVDEADKYVYAVSSNGVWNNGSSMTLGRVPRERIARLDPSDWEFIQTFTEQGEPVWRPRHDTARYIFRSPGKTSMTGIHYIAPLGLYILPQWHYTALDDPALRWKRTKFQFYQAEAPWGPWSLFCEQDFAESWYNPCIPSKFISPDGCSLWVFAAGDFTNNGEVDSNNNYISYYGLWMMPLRLEVA